jgi:hypothetical protein
MHLLASPHKTYNFHSHVGSGMIIGYKLPDDVTLTWTRGNFYWLYNKYQQVGLCWYPHKYYREHHVGS